MNVTLGRKLQHELTGMNCIVFPLSIYHEISIF